MQSHNWRKACEVSKVGGFYRRSPTFDIGINFSECPIVGQGVEGGLGMSSKGKEKVSEETLPIVRCYDDVSCSVEKIIEEINIEFGDDNEICFVTPIQDECDVRHAF